ncbi:putative F-box protein At3g47150 [Papaver somniferum]|uniref:putative F-box protein At3g47150 n=1 Tax=Papaver somniferum TaxID=3469 RepID=UPI000E6FDFFE|nr:putative F-box protein At3g47150 [Papaver somniferum]
MSMWRRLPEENQVDIFLKLPVNSILACRCVCKIWFNLLRNPKFIKNHLSRSIRYNNNPRLMIVQPQYGKNPIISSVDYKSISSSSPSELKVVSINYPFEDKEIEGIVTLGSCNGLICFGISTGKGIEAKNYICIWNPSTGEYKTIKLPVYECVAE